jgi:hypothetical protein
MKKRVYNIKLLHSLSLILFLLILLVLAIKKWHSNMYWASKPKNQGETLSMYAKYSLF